MRLSSSGFSQQPQEGERRSLNSELWHACAGPLVSLPAIGSRVVYFPQGHSEQVAASTNKEVDAHIPNYPNLPPQLICQLHNVTMHADVETDEVYAQMTLQPFNLQEQREPSSLVPELGAPSKQPTNYFCKTLTASDTSTHGGFSVPRRAAEKVFPPLDFTQQPPVQELIARDLHDNEWKFRHIYRGQPKRHLLTTGWSVFVSAKRLVAGDSVLFIRNENGKLLLGIRRANRSQTVMPSLVLSSDSMHIGVLAAAAHATATNSRFTVFYNPRASPSEFVIPLGKYEKAIYHTRVSAGMRFRMLFETEESSVRRYMGTITGFGDLDPARWPNSQWRSVKVGWDESTAGERQPRVSLWEIEPLTTFLMYPPPYPLRLKRPWPQLQGMSSIPGINDDDCKMMKSIMWTGGDNGEQHLQGLNFQGLGMDPWMQMQDRFDSSVAGVQPDMYKSMAAAALQEIRSVDSSKQLLQLQPQQPVQSQQLHCVPQPLVHRQIFQHQQYPQHILQQRAQNLQQQQQSQQNIHQQQAQSTQQQQPHHHILQQQTLNVLPQQTPQHVTQHAQNVQQQIQQQSSQHQVLQQLQQSYVEQKQSTSQQVQCQQQTFKISHVAGALSQTPVSLSDSPISLPSNVSSQPVLADSNANIASHASLPIFYNLRTLVLNNCGITWKQVERLKKSLPVLEELHLGGNRLRTIEPLGEDTSGSSVSSPDMFVQGFDSLKVLSLEGNGIERWEEIAKLSQLTRLEQLHLSNNMLKNIIYPQHQKLDHCLSNEPELWNAQHKPFENLRCLLLGGNKIEDWASIDALNLFPSLRDVRLSDNPISNPTKGGALRYILIARLSKVTMLNGSEVKQRERKDSEIRYVRFVMSTMQGKSEEEIAREHPRFAELKAQHDIPDESWRVGVTGPQKMAAGLLSITLTCVGASAGEKAPITKKLPSTTTVGKLKLLCQGFFKLTPMKQRLFLQEQDSPIPTPLNDDMETLADLGIGASVANILVDDVENC